jgi:hypothetical protein
VASKGGEAEIASTRYPFCFTGGEKDPGGTRSILPFLPFNEDLNRFHLVVKNLSADKAEVSWGEAKKTFARSELEKGINLADEFIENPFVKPFQNLDRAVANKQQYETHMIKRIVTNFRSIRETIKDDAELDDLLDALYTKLASKQMKLQETARAAVVPVKHKITVTPK